jgi:hypothetical protein
VDLSKSLLPFGVLLTVFSPKHRPTGLKREMLHCIFVIDRQNSEIASRVSNSCIILRTLNMMDLVPVIQLYSTFAFEKRRFSGERALPRSGKPLKGTGLF